MKKIGSVLLDIVIGVWLLVAIFVTICLLSYNEFIILNNIALLDEKQMKELIVNKCNLENINLTIESLLIDNIDKTCNDIKNLINYENIIKSGISIEDITLYLDYKKMNS